MPARNIRRRVKTPLAWFKVVDNANYLLYFVNGTDPTSLDSFQFDIEIKQEDFNLFAFCNRPDDFTVLLNGNLAIVSYGTLPDSSVIWSENDGVTLKRIQTIYPDPVTDEDKPLLRFQLIANPLSLPLSSNVLTVKITNDDKQILNITATLNYPFSTINIVKNVGGNKITPRTLDGVNFKLV